MNGTSLAATTRVNFGSAAVTPASVTATQVTFVVPSAAPCSGQVSVSVTSNTSASGTTLIDYYLAPAITSVVPATGTAGDQITINGTGLVNVDTVTFTDSAAATATAVFTPISATQLVATVPGGLATGAGTITLHTCGGNSNAQDFTITWPPGTGHRQHEPSSRRPRIGGTGGDVPPPTAVAAAAPSAPPAR
ncbi:IPT/TIG domain-containing protein, partial [Streptomyces hygroscopicus]|uniref:IPT/TIG domain-containing protein n=1 Tax=Streptomyces hygroscopicus TaxID=1912 RepID=UPI003695D8EE